MLTLLRKYNYIWKYENLNKYGTIQFLKFFSLNIERINSCSKNLMQKIKL